MFKSLISCYNYIELSTKKNHKFNHLSNYIHESNFVAKGLVAELAPPHTQSTWGSRGKRVRAAGLAACHNYLSKKKKKSLPSSKHTYSILGKDEL